MTVAVSLAGWVLICVGFFCLSFAVAVAFGKFIKYRDRHAQDDYSAYRRHQEVFEAAWQEFHRDRSDARTRAEARIKARKNNDEQ